MALSAITCSIKLHLLRLTVILLSLPASFHFTSFHFSTVFCKSNLITRCCQMISSHQRLRCVNTTSVKKQLSGNSVFGQQSMEPSAALASIRFASMLDERLVRLVEQLSVLFSNCDCDSHSKLAQLPLLSLYSINDYCVYGLLTAVYQQSVASNVLENFPNFPSFLLIIFQFFWFFDFEFHRFS